MIENGDYKFRDDMVNEKSKDTVPIQILTGPYKNVIYRYTKVGVREQNDGTAVLRFEYDLLDVAENTETKLRNDRKFEQHLGILLNYFILESLEKTDNESREDDFTESSEQPRLL
ncbi:MAG: hypothetical protein EB127_19490 [Alphaproteobacteria bacterium]|nr:hypothetical protein [Alphaproteobacteria bacterium]